MYGVLSISRELLGIDDNWFFLDVFPEKKQAVAFDLSKLSQPEYHVNYRGWFVNDEVMISEWKEKGSTQFVWERIYETLLRHGGNMIISGTDKNSHLNRKLAGEFGLIVTHHHAEPLGAKMFVRKYPELEASFIKYPEMFKQIWIEAIKEQADSEVIWGLGFRGQGDRPFWVDDTSKQWTEEMKAEVINSVIQLQYDLVKEANPKAMCAVNIYGELTEMHNSGLLKLPKDVIEIWADNGYGKMVSRRQGNDDPRAEIFSSMNKENRLRGIYYHVAFHDLQASNFLTKLPNSPEFVSQELEEVRRHQMDTFVLVNTGNIKPHILFLQEVSKSWRTSYRARSMDEILIDYLKYYPSYFKEEIKQSYKNYFEFLIQYGNNEDQHAGDEFYTYTIRKIVQSSIRNDQRLEQMEWLTGNQDISEQLETIQKLIISKVDDLKTLYHRSVQLYERMQDEPENAVRFYNDLLMDIGVHFHGATALLNSIKAFQYKLKHEYLHSYIAAYDAKQSIDKIVSLRKENPSAKWRDFYKNDVFTNIDLTKRLLETWMQYFRIMGDNHEQYEWERNYLMEPSDAKVMLLSNTHDALSDEYLASKLKSLIHD